MRWRLLMTALPAAWLLTVAASPSPPVSVPPVISPAPTPAATATPVPTAPATPTPAPTPTPFRGSVSISPTLGPTGTTITVTGAGFPPGVPVVIYWDSNQKPLGSTAADAGGAFKVDVKAADGDLNGHSVCAQAAGAVDACATFKLEATPSPSPSATPTPAAAPTSSATAIAAPNPTPDAGISPVAALLQPPFVIFPILVLLAAIGGAVFWIVAGTRRRQAPVSAARVSHATARPAQPVEAPAPRASAPPSPPPTAPGPRPLAGDDSIDLPQPGD